LRPSSQMLDPIRAGLPVDFSDLPAVFPLYGAEQAPDRGPGTPPDFTPRQLCPNAAFHLGPPQRPSPHRIEMHVSWEWAVLPPPLHGSVLQQV
jgi:hypothetical protein